MDIEQEVTQIVAEQEHEKAMKDFYAAMAKLSENVRELRAALGEEIDGR